MFEYVLMLQLISYTGPLVFIPGGGAIVSDPVTIANQFVVAGTYQTAVECRRAGNSALATIAESQSDTPAPGSITIRTRGTFFCHRKQAVNAE